MFFGFVTQWRLSRPTYVVERICRVYGEEIDWKLECDTEDLYPFAPELLALSHTQRYTELHVPTGAIGGQGNTRYAAQHGVTQRYTALQRATLNALQPLHTQRYTERHAQSITQPYTAQHSATQRYLEIV